MKNGVAYPDSAVLQDGSPQVGWMTYLSRELGTIPSVRAPHRVDTVGSAGYLVVVRPQLWDRNDERHRESVASLRAELDAWGVLQADPTQLSGQP